MGIPGARGGSLRVGLFTTVLATAASTGCAPAASAPLPGIAPPAPAAELTPARSSSCSTATSKDEDLAAAHAAVREALVANKKEEVAAIHELNVWPDGHRPEEIQELDEAKRAAVDKADEVNNAKLEAAYAAVDAAEAQGKGTASDHAARIELGGETVGYFFTGLIPETCRCGSGYAPGWGILVVKDGCAWKRVGGSFTADELEAVRAPDGALVFVQLIQGDGGCGGQTPETRLVLVKSAAEVHDLHIPGIPAIERVCSEPMHRAEIQREHGTLTGVRIFSNTADSNGAEPMWTETGSVVFEKGQYVERNVGR